MTKKRRTATSIAIATSYNFKICRSEAQRCVHCSNVIGFKKWGLSINNYQNAKASCNGKNIWVHINCIPLLAENIKVAYETHKKLAVTLSI